MKKRIALALAMAICLSLLCTVALADKVTVNFFHRWPNEPKNSYINSLIDEFEAANPDIDIVSDCVLNDSYKEKIRVLVSTDALPDVFFSWSGVFGENLTRSGRVLALDDVMARDSEWSSQIVEGQWAPFNYNGKQYGAPWSMDGKAFFYNVDVFNELGIEIFDIYGLTEIYGPGIGISCEAHHGMHVWEDFVYVEIVDPKTGEVLPDGEVGEIVLTTLRKQGAPLIRYRTHDLSRIIPGACTCEYGSHHPRIDTIVGRTDDMVKVKGCNMFPAQIEEVINFTEGTSSEYQMMIEAINGRDVITLLFETALTGEDREKCERELEAIFKAKIGCTPEAKGVPIGELPRSEKKTKRIFDSRY